MLVAGTVGVAPGTSTIRVPYATSVADMNGGLGLIDPNDSWHTGDEHGHLPGTATIQLGGDEPIVIAGLTMKGVVVVGIAALLGGVVGHYLGRR